MSHRSDEQCGPDPEPSPAFEALLGYEPSPGRLAGRVILVTGAAQGIGRAVAAGCARHGACTVLVDCDEPRLGEAHEEFVRRGWPPPALCPMDLARCTIDDFRTVASGVGERFGRLDGLVNHAGWIGELAPFEHAMPSVWGRVINVNLAAPFFLTQWCMGLLRRSSGPAVVFSLHDVRRAYWGGYGIAKAGLEGFMHILADEYHPSSPCALRVTGIDTGPVMTADRKRHYPGERRGTHPAPAEVVGPYLWALAREGDDGGCRLVRAIRADASAPRVPASARY
ncbi:MAG: SDR family NAD(P)-dependent oxidoreductase [Arenicellales bacterium]